MRPRSSTSLCPLAEPSAGHCLRSSSPGSFPRELNAPSTWPSGGVEQYASRQPNATFEIVDRAGFGLPHLDEPASAALSAEYRHPRTQRWSRTVAAFDTFIFVTPEYNHSFPGALKTAVDSLFREGHARCRAPAPARRRAQARRRPHPDRAVALSRLQGHADVPARPAPRGDPSAHARLAPRLGRGPEVAAQPRRYARRGRAANGFCVSDSLLQEAAPARGPSFAAKPLTT